MIAVAEAQRRAEWEARIPGADAIRASIARWNSGNEGQWALDEDSGGEAIAAGPPP
ncbi:MAG: hypothetical protein QOJ50_76 [Cryptosporangiaceae bacterium]|nr:hypothetical protein [Cryptosporangiaceae bacterium]